MNRIRIILAVLAAVTLLAGVAPAADPSYVYLVQGAEKWFRCPVDKVEDVCHRLHTVVEGTYGGVPIQRFEIYEDNLLVESRRLLFDIGREGDILLHGDLNAWMLDTPITWVDAPLEVGKTWYGSRTATSKLCEPGTVHYLFGVVEQAPVDCDLGTFDCFRVLVAIAYPDGSAEALNYWYNERCGMIRCNPENGLLYAMTKFLTPDIDDPHDPDDPFDPDTGLLSPDGLNVLPNPFNPATTVAFELKAAASVQLEVFDLAGRRVRTLLTGAALPAGPARVPWDGTDDQGRTVASGTYLVRLAADKAVAFNRMQLVR